MIITIIGATYAYFIAQGGGTANTDVNVGTNTTDNLSFNVGEAINITANPTNFAEGMGNQAGSTTASATLTANNATNSATANYYLYLNITGNELSYTVDENTPELLLTVIDPTESPVESISGLKYVTVGADDDAVSGFDITTTSGLITLANNYEITSTGTETQEWNITVTFVNLDSDQQGNTGKSFNASLIIKQDELNLADICGEDNLSDCLATKIYTEDGENGLYLHDGAGSYTNSNLEANDNSLRFSGSDYQLTELATTAGYTQIVALNATNNTGGIINFYCNDTKQYFGYDCASPQTFYYTLNYDESTHYQTYNEAITQAISDGYLTKDNIKNYVCFGSDAETCPADNLYRIIGVFDGKIKLIKADFASSATLGTAGEYSSQVYNNNEYPTYKGNLTTVDRYYRNYETATNAWEDSKLYSENLNINYWSSLETNWQNMISDTTWYTGGMYWEYSTQVNAKEAYDYEVGANKNPDISNSSKIGLMYISDYYYAASPNHWSIQGCTNATSLNPDDLYGPEYDYRSSTNDNWMFMGLMEWTISHTLNYANRAYYINSSGYVGDATVNARFYGVRPVFNLVETVKVTGGTGTSSNPLRLSV